MKRLSMRAAGTLAVVAALLAAGCGGGGGSPGACISGSPQVCDETSTGPTVIESSSQRWAEVCTLEGAKNFTRAYMDEAYLWYREIPAIDPAPYTSIGRYFYDLLTPALDANGQRKDRFSFIVTAADADSITTGEVTAYGLQWETDAQGRQRVAFVEAGSPAQAAGLARGAELVEVLTPGTPDWYPNTGSEITFTWRPAPGQPAVTTTLRSVALQEDPLPLVRNLVSPAGRRVAYLLFNAHTRGAQDKLIAAVTGLQQAGVNELVLDLRYNRGGFLYTALAVSSMLTGPQADGRVFEQLQFNDKRPDETQANVLNFSGLLQVGESSYAAGAALPRLALPRVYALTTGSTCSASESIINGLRGVGLEVVVVGGTTCGKPYGFIPRDNCGTTYFAVQFQGVNHLGEGDYADGIAPTCTVSDDFSRALGDPAESRLAAALAFRDTGKCPALPTAGALRSSVLDTGEPLLSGKSPGRTGRILRPGTFGAR